jgi:hypothetical protein
MLLFAPQGSVGIYPPLERRSQLARQHPPAGGERFDVPALSNGGMLRGSVLGEPLIWLITHAHSNR